MKTFGIIDQLENKIGKPVISALQATIWECLRLAGETAIIRGRGKLMSQ
jgi:maleate isomerase